jgi:hypothetical protein
MVVVDEIWRRYSVGILNRIAISGCLVLTVGLHAAAADPDLPLILKDDFERGMDHWQTTDPRSAAPVWKIIDVGAPGGHALRVTGISKYQPPHRSPHSIALLKDVIVGDFDLSVRVQETNVQAGPHRDLCIFWGYQDPSHYYYVHLGAKADPHACQIFIVNDAPRKMITVDQAKGTPWTERWHNVKVVHRVDDGTMEVYFDDMEKPMMTARDKTFTWGQVGIGTFDDHGNFDDFELRGERVEKLNK